MGEKRAEAFGVLKNMLAPEMADALSSGTTTLGFAGKMGEMAMNNVFEPLWTDETFDLRTRSLVTVSMLIALRAYDELEVHFPAAIRNGATIADLEQVLYQATGYAGFPAANSARTVAIGRCAALACWTDGVEHLSGKSAIVTSAASDIGRAAALALAALGTSIVVAETAFEPMRLCSKSVDRSHGQPRNCNGMRRHASGLDHPPQAAPRDNSNASWRGSITSISMLQMLRWASERNITGLPPTSRKTLEQIYLLGALPISQVQRIVGTPLEKTCKVDVNDKVDEELAVGLLEQHA